MKYESWIKENFPTKESAFNRCNVATRAITATFPELEVQVGYANGTLHCWAKAPDGSIVDPTALQLQKPIKYTLIANRFLKRHEFEPATGAVFLDDEAGGVV